jgi:hypothetical protein
MSGKTCSLMCYVFHILKPCFTFTFQVMNLIGDVKGKVAVMMDDMIDTAGESSTFDAKLQS